MMARDWKEEEEEEQEEEEEPIDYRYHDITVFLTIASPTAAAAAS